MRSSLELLKRTLTSWVGEIGETPKAPNGFFSKNTFFLNAGICIVLRLITGFRSPKHFAITVLTNSNSDFSYLLHKGIKKNFKAGYPQFWSAPVLEKIENLRRSGSALRLIDVHYRGLQKLGWGGHCSTHRLGATCDYVKSN